MNQKDLQIKIAEVLGVSSTQKELAYEIFMEKIYESLHEDLTLKVPRLGFFQFKKYEPIDDSGRSIIYSSLSEDFDRDSRNLYLTLHVTPKSKSTVDFDANVFSIGVGKPLLPLTVEDMPNSETSFAMLRKSIEERAKELIAESDHIPNFDLFEDYYNLNDEQNDDAADVKFTLANLTSDLDIVHVEEEPSYSEPATDDVLLNSLMDFSQEQEEPVTEPKEPELNIIDEPILMNEPEVEETIPEPEDVAELLTNNEKLPEIMLADLLSDSIPSEEPIESKLEDEIENGPEKIIAEEAKEQIEKEPEETVEKEVESISINDYLNQPEEAKEEEIADTVNIETFLKSKEEDIFPNEEPVIEKTEQTFAKEETQPKFISLNTILEGRADEETPLLAKNLDDNVAGASSEEPKEQEESNGLSVEQPSVEDIHEKNHARLFGAEPIAESIEVKPGPELEPESEPAQELESKPKPELKKTSVEKFSEPSRETETALSIDQLLEESDYGIQKDDELLREEDNEREEKIEWNWGDELKEEFGLGLLSGEDAKFEMVDDKDWQDDEEPVSGKKLYKDLFAQLEKTIEKEKTIYEEQNPRHDDRRFIEEEPKKPEQPRETFRPIIVQPPQDEPYTPRETSERKFATMDKEPSNKFSLKDDEKVYLEFSNPPTKYEFVAEKKAESGKRRSIVLDEEFPSPPPVPTYEERRTHYTREIDREAPRPQQKENYFGKIFILIFSAFVIISASIYFLLRNNSSQKESVDTALQRKLSADNSVVDSIIQAQAKSVSKDSTREGLDEFSDFPTTATPPAPVSHKTNAQIINETALQQNNIVEEKPQPKKNESITSKKAVAKPQTKQASQNDLYRTLSRDDRIDKAIYFDGSKYNFQTSSWRNKEKAEMEAKRLRKLGMNAFITEAYLPQKGGTWYRVRIGSFKSQREAKEFMTSNNY